MTSSTEHVSTNKYGDDRTEEMHGEGREGWVLGRKEDPVRVLERTHRCTSIYRSNVLYH